MTPTPPTSRDSAARPTTDDPLFDLVYRLHDDGAIDEDQVGELCMAIARAGRARATAGAVEGADPLRETARKVADYSWGLHLAGTPNEAEAINLIEALRASLRTTTPEAPAAATEAGLDALNLIRRLSNDGDPMSQDEMGGCVWCGGSPPRSGDYGYATAHPNSHSSDCPWLEAQRFLAARAAAGEGPGGER